MLLVYPDSLASKAWSSSYELVSEGLTRSVAFVYRAVYLSGAEVRRRASGADGTEVAQENSETKC